MLLYCFKNQKDLLILLCPLILLLKMEREYCEIALVLKLAHWFSFSELINHNGTLFEKTWMKPKDTKGAWDRPSF